MKTWFILLALCCIILSCNKPKAFDYSLLEGDWVYTNLPENNDPMAPRSMMGSMPLSLRNLKTGIYDSVYKIIKDTILFKIRNNRYEDKFSWYPKFTIKNLTKDSLMLYALRDSLEYTLYNSDLIRDTTIHIDRICYSASGCYGRCPAFNLEINRDDSVFYYGASFTKKTGLHFGKISPTIFAYFEELMQKTNIEKLDSVYERGVTDNQAIGINVFYNKGKLKSIYIYPARSFDLPFINLLSDNLIYFDTYFHLTKSENSYDFPHNKFPNGFQIPMLPVLKTFTPPVVE